MLFNKQVVRFIGSSPLLIVNGFLLGLVILCFSFASARPHVGGSVTQSCHGGSSLLFGLRSASSLLGLRSYRPNTKYLSMNWPIDGSCSRLSMASTISFARRSSTSLL
jgi:hypothetical protein